MGEVTECPLHFVVVGDSVCGLGCAYTLSFVGHNVTIVEKCSEANILAQRFNGGIRLPPNAARVIRLFPNTEPVLSNKIDGLSYRSAETSELVGRMVFDPDIMTDLGSDYYLSSHHEYTKFVRNFCTLQGVKFKYDFEVQDIYSSREGPAAVISSDGERLEGDVVIGADGHDSLVRRFILSQEREDEDDEDDDDDSTSASADVPVGLRSEIVGATISVHVDDMRPHPELQELLNSKDATIWMGDGYCLHGGLHGPVYVLGLNTTAPLQPEDQDLPWHEKTTVEYFAAKVPGLNPVLKKLISIAREAHPTIQSTKALDNFRDIHSRVLIVGDAAHVTPIHGTHNSSLGLEDCFTVGRLFAHITDRSQIPELLRGFNEVRIPRIKHVEKSELQAFLSSCLGPGPHRDLRNRGMANSLVYANAPSLYAKELADLWMGWISLQTFDSRDAVDEWWHQWGKLIRDRAIKAQLDGETS